MNVLVTGGAGFIGSHLVDALVAQGFQVKVLDNLHRGKLENIRSHLQAGSIEFVQKDIRDYDSLVQEFAQMDAVFHLAAQSNVLGAVQDMDYSFYSNVVGTYNVLKACQVNRVKRLIFTSSREAYGEAQYLPVDENHPLTSKNTYGASKVAGETYCRVFHNMGQPKVVILRLANVYGERDFNRVIPIFLDNVLNGQDIRIFGGKQVIDFVAVEIVVQALLQSLTNDQALQGPINVGSGKGTTLFTLAETIMKLTGATSKIIVEAPRQVEVVRFTANIERFKKIFHIEIPEDPLYYLPKMIEAIKAAEKTQN